MVLASGRADEASLLARLGLDHDDDGATFVDADEVYDVIELIVADGCTHLAVRSAELLDIDSYGALGLAFKTSRDLRSALERLVRYGDLVSDAIRYELRPTSGGGALLVVTGRPAARPGIRAMNEAVLAGVLAFCRQASGLGSALAPRSVSFAHGQHEGAERLGDALGCPVVFDGELDALHLDDAFLSSPTQLADQAISRFLSEHLDAELRATAAQRGVGAQVRQIVAAALSDGVPPMRLVADRLTVSERTLRRRLAEDGSRYDAIVVDVRRSLAETLLSTTDHPIVDIAFLVGFSDQPSFHRAFKRWTGSTPRQVRRGQGQEAGRNGQ
ncbi:MAG: AraC family transcriptional regulator [Actinomycetota bacterium]